MESAIAGKLKKELPPLVRVNPGSGKLLKLKMDYAPTSDASTEGYLQSKLISDEVEDEGFMIKIELGGQLRGIAEEINIGEFRGEGDPLTYTYGLEADKDPFKKEFLNALNEAYEECSHENWDGEGAKAINLKIYTYAKNFINFIPTIVPSPEIFAEFSGEISFDWRPGKGKALYLTLKNDGLCVYSFINGIERKSAILYLDFESLKEVWNLISKIY